MVLQPSQQYVIMAYTRQDNGEKRMQAIAPLYLYPCYTLN